MREYEREDKEGGPCNRSESAPLAGASGWTGPAHIMVLAQTQPLHCVTLIIIAFLKFEISSIFEEDQLDQLRHVFPPRGMVTEAQDRLQELERAVSGV